MTSNSDRGAGTPRATITDSADSVARIMYPVDRVVWAFHTELEETCLMPNGDGWQGKCPNHRTNDDDELIPNDALHVAADAYGHTLVRCSLGCDYRYNNKAPHGMVHDGRLGWIVEDVVSTLARLDDGCSVDIDALASLPEPEREWLIPGVLELRDRLILTGPEGHGKSTLLRQLGMQVASGIHPWTLAAIEPQRVLIVDLENPRPLVRRKIAELRAMAADQYRPDLGLRLAIRPEGLPLDTDGGREWLESEVDYPCPALLIIGPLYKMVTGDPNDERTARAVAGALDRIRETTGCAIIIEAHSPHGREDGRGRERRPERPAGASLWRRWPEFGLHLNADGHLRPWRSPRDARDFPAALARDGHWPWTVVTREQDQLWARIVATCVSRERRLSQRDLATAVGASKTSVARAIDDHRDEWETLTF